MNGYSYFVPVDCFSTDGNIICSNNTRSSGNISRDMNKLGLGCALIRKHFVTFVDADIILSALCG